MNTPQTNRAQGLPATIVVTMRVGRKALLTTFDSAKLFTAAKGDWITCLACDARSPPYDRVIGIVVAQHINWRTGQWKLAEETIAYESGCSTRNVTRALKRLRKRGWLTWRRTLTANVYRLDFGNVKAILERLREARDGRKKRGGNVVQMDSGVHLEMDSGVQLTLRRYTQRRKESAE
jgi:hypothetical protein